MRLQAPNCSLKYQSWALTPEVACLTYNYSAVVQWLVCNSIRMAPWAKESTTSLCSLQYRPSATEARAQGFRIERSIWWLQNSVE